MPAGLFFLVTILLVHCLAAAEPQPLASLFEMQSAKEWKVAGNKLEATRTDDADGGHLTLAVPAAGGTAYDVVLHSQPFPNAIRKGEHVLVELPLSHSFPTDGPGRYSLYIEGKQLEMPFSSDRETTAQEVIVREAFTATRDYDADTLWLSLHASQQAQTLRIGKARLTSYAASIPLEKLPGTPVSYLGAEPGAPWRRAAHERIQKLRMSPVRVKVINTAGEPVRGARITWDQKQHAFGFGCFCEAPVLQQDKAGETYRRHYLDLFNYGTIPGYLAEWGWLNAENRAQSLRIADWLQQHEIPARGHLLVYPGYVATPPAWKDLPPAERRQQLEAHIPALLRSLGSRGVREFDVVNELRDNISFCNELGGTSGLDNVAEWFKMARRHAPEASLYINEYWIVAGGGYTRREQDLYEITIKDLLAKNAPIDGIGIQGHFGAQLTPPARVIEILDRFAALGKRIRITEFDIDIRDETAQADYTRDFYTAVFSHPAVDGIVQWGFWEGNQWKPAAAMFRKDWTPKPNYEAFRTLTQKTLASHHAAQTKDNGMWEASIFQGRHQLQVKSGDYEYSRPVVVSTAPFEITVVVP
jgi:endo-1,4-beta-xylanase